MNAAKVVEVVVDKFASKKFGILSLANTLIMILVWGRGEIVVIAGIVAVCILSTIGVVAIAKYENVKENKSKS